MIYMKIGIAQCYVEISDPTECKVVKNDTIRLSWSDQKPNFKMFVHLNLPLERSLMHRTELARHS